MRYATEVDELMNKFRSDSALTENIRSIFIGPCILRPKVKVRHSPRYDVPECAFIVGHPGTMTCLVDPEYFRTMICSKGIVSTLAHLFFRPKALLFLSSGVSCSRNVTSLAEN